VQDRLPIWLGYQGPKGARRAGLMGEGLLTLAASSWPHYRDGLAEAGHDRAAARMGGGVQAYLTDDPERDWPLVAPHIAYAQDSYRRYMVEGTDHPVPRPVDPDRLRTKGPAADQGTGRGPDVVLPVRHARTRSRGDPGLRRPGPGADGVARCGRWSRRR
jgi:hypothetical protein